MPTSLPPVEEMLNFASERTGKTIEQLKKAIEKYSTKYAEVIRSSDRLMTYLYLKEELGLTPPISTVPPSEIVSIEEVKKSLAKSGLSTEGYLIRQWTFTTSSQNEAIGFILLDKTGSMLGMLFNEQVIENWKNHNLQTGDFIRLRNFGVNEYEGRKSMRVSARTQIEKVNKPPYSIEETATPISQLRDGECLVIHATLLTTEETEYIGCPYCGRKLDVKEGQKADCQKCGEVIAEKQTWIRALATDGTEDIQVTIPPRLVKKYGKKAIEDSYILTLAGTYRKSEGEFMVEYIAMPTQKTVAKPQTVEPSANMLEEKIPLLLQSWNGMPEDKLIEQCRNLMNATEEETRKAIENLMNQGKIKLEKGIYTVTN